MNTIIAKSINLHILFLSHTKAPCKIEYLEPVNNNFLKFYMNTLEKLIRIKFERVKMGRFSNASNIKLHKIAVDSATKKVKKIRKNLYANSSFEIINILNEDHIRKIWYEYAAFELVLIYSKEKKLSLKNSSRIIFIQTKERNILNKICQKINNLISIEILRLSSFLAFFIKNILRNKSNIKPKYQFIENVILGSEPYSEDCKDECFRNQKIISKNVFNSENFLIVDTELRMAYSFNIKFKIKYSSFLEFLSSFIGLLPSISEYHKFNCHLNILSVYRTLKISYLLWSATRRINTKKFVMNGNSHYGSGFLIVSRLLNIPAYIYQYSLLNQMNPYLHNPLTGIMGFTKDHINMFLRESNLIKGSVKSSLIIKYPFAANVSEKRIQNLRSFLLKNFDLSIAYFDENYCIDNYKIHAAGAFFYEDAKYDIKNILLMARSNPRIAIIFKSQHCAKSLKNYILNDPDLKLLYNPKQIFDMFVPTSYNDRNIIVPEEISKSVDICLNYTSGGTAGYESLASKCRTIFIKSGYSNYDAIIPNKLLIKSINDFENLLKSVNFNRRDLFKTKLGKLDINEISKF